MLPRSEGKSHAGIAAPYAQHSPALGLLALVVTIALFYATIRYLLIPRVRNIGWSPWRLLWLLVPVAGVIFLLLLFFLPAKKNA